MSQCSITFFENVDCSALDTLQTFTLITSLNTCLDTNSTVQSVEMVEGPGCSDSVSDTGYLLAYNNADCSGNSWTNISQLQTCLGPGANGLEVKSVKIVCAPDGPNGFAATVQSTGAGQTMTSSISGGPQSTGGYASNVATALKSSTTGYSATSTGTGLGPAATGNSISTPASGLTPGDIASIVVGVVIGITGMVVMVLIFMGTTRRRNAIETFKTWFCCCHC